MSKKSSRQIMEIIERRFKFIACLISVLTPLFILSFGKITIGQLVGAATITIFSNLSFITIMLKDAKEKTAFEWDKQVIMHKVIDILSYMGYGCLMVFILLIWNTLDNKLWLWLLSFFFIFALCIYTIMALRIYLWLINNTYEDSLTYQTVKRLEYLEEDITDHNLANIWNKETWKKLNNQSAIEQAQLFRAFVKNMENMKNQNIKADIINELQSNLDKLNLANADIYKNLFNLAFAQTPEYKASDQILKVRIYQLQNKLTNLSLVTEHPKPYYLLDLFFTNTKNHNKGLKNEKSNKSTEEFMQVITDSFFRALRENKYEFMGWNNFPNEWKININNLGKEKISYMWLKAYEKHFSETMNEFSIYPYFDNIFKSRDGWNIMRITAKLMPDIEINTWNCLLGLRQFSLLDRDENVAVYDIERFILRWEALQFDFWSFTFKFEEVDNKSIKEEWPEEILERQVKETIAIFEKMSSYSFSENIEVIDNLIEKTNKVFEGFKLDYDNPKDKQRILSTKTLQNALKGIKIIVEQL